MTVFLTDGSVTTGDCDGSSDGQITDPEALVVPNILQAPVFPLGTILAVIAPLLALGCYMIIALKRKAAIAN